MSAHLDLASADNKISAKLVRGNDVLLVVHIDVNEIGKLCRDGETCDITTSFGDGDQRHVQVSRNCDVGDSVLQVLPTLYESIFYVLFSQIAFDRNIVEEIASLHRKSTKEVSSLFNQCLKGK